MGIGTAFTQFLGRQYQVNSTEKHFPFLNSAIISSSGNSINSAIQTNMKKRLMRWYEKNAAVLTGIINMVARDINENFYFEPVRGKESNRNRVIKGEDFAESNSFKGINFAVIVDLLVTGEGYAYKGMIKDAMLKHMASQSLQKKGLPDTAIMRNLLIKSNFPDEESRTLRKVINLASETIENRYDMYEIKNYVQKIGGRDQEFNLNEIIHFKLMDINGRPNGFTPLSTLITQLELDYFMWQNMTAVSKNSGQADKLYTVEDAQMNSPSFKRIEQNLKKYHNMKNRHGSLLLSGKVTVQELQQLDSMQFENLGVYIAGLVALQWSVSKSRLPFMSKSADVKEGTGGTSEKSYYDNIEYCQDIIANYWNQQLWIPHFGLKMKHKKSYKQDELKETQNKQMKIDNLSAIETQLAKNKKQLTKDYKLRYFNGVVEDITEEDLEDLEIDPLQLGGPENNRNNQLSLDKLSDNDTRANLRQQRTEEQAASADQGKQQPAKNTSKEIDDEFIDFKELLKEDMELKEVQRVPFRTFMRLYNEDKVYINDNLRVFLSSSEDMTRLIYRSSDFVYETVVASSMITSVDFMNFRKLYKIDEPSYLKIVDRLEDEEDEKEDDIEVV